MKKNVLLGMMLAIGLAQAAHAEMPVITPQLLEQLQALQAAQQKQAEAAKGGAIQPEQDVLAQISKWPAAAKGLVIEGLKDGFKVNNQRFIDPEGVITRYSSDPTTGNVGYLVRQDAANFVIKVSRVGVNVDPVTVASATFTGSEWKVTTASGKKLIGDTVIPTSTGVVVARQNTGFYYAPKQGVVSFSAPEDFAIADFQSGDIGSTEFILIERVQDRSDENKLTNGFKALGSMLGVGEKADYQLLHVKTGALVPFNIPVENKDVVIGGSGCSRQNSFTMKCKSLDFAASVYDANGLPNFGHYYWRLRWYKSEKGIYALGLEDGLRKLTLTNLSEPEKKSVLFERLLGIAGFRAGLNKSGMIDVTARLGFFEESKQDVEQGLN